MTRPSEADLAAGLRAGQADALTELFDRHADRIFRHCFRLTADRADAEDATATVFLEVWRHRQRVQVHDGTVVPWLYGVATNVCRNLTRGRRRHLRAVSRLPQPEVQPDHADRVAERLDTEQRAREVLDAIERLPQRERDVVALVAWSGLSYEAAAAALDVPVGTVRSRLSRARRRLDLPATSEGA
ncbi:RNA polymerase sigma factor [Nocardioides sp.]|uniref:RNA polymerase sigma factor n=1 Tax=Nocardioides sp. TaxID=35761 RepID=UPI002726A86B|nr:sigma-70 family RNA polymerase sigma factor [Nocardioides sp.]MDO9458432.1 sigma-70 family RNA polymerase sigma factor [Nocardioides sp.]